MAHSDRRQDCGIGILLGAAPGLGCLCVLDAYDTCRGTFARPQAVRAAIRVSSYAEFSPCGRHFHAWAQRQAGQSWGLRHLRVFPASGFVPITGHRVHLEPSRTEEVEAKHSEHGDEIAFGPRDFGAMGQCVAPQLSLPSDHHTHAYAPVHDWESPLDASRVYSEEVGHDC